MDFHIQTRAPLGLIVVIVAASLVGSARPIAGRVEVGHPVRGMVAIIDASAPWHDIFNGQFCGGVLVGPNRVLTAAHCVVGREPATINAVVGADHLCRGWPIDGTRITVSDVSVHPGFDAATGQFDLAVLTLERAVPAGWVRTVADGVPATGEALALGWGRTSLGGVPSCRLTRTALSVRNQAECAARFSGESPAFDEFSMLCADPLGARWEDTCAGDSGGPLFLGNDPDAGLLLGVVSWGRGCGADWPGVYARVNRDVVRWLSHQN